jgi:hypothetical protein
MRAVVASILVLLVVGRVARGDAQEDAAQVHLDRGIAAFNAKDFTTARHELQAATELAPHKPNPYRWLALTEVQLNDCEHAVVDIDAFVARVPTGDPRIAELARLRELCQHRSAPTPAPAPEQPEETPITHRVWFWAVIAGAAFVISGVLYATHDGTTTFPTVACDATGCRAP